MVIFFDLNAPTEPASEPPWDDPYRDTVMLIATPRNPTPLPRQPKPAEPLDDDALITWEDAEWQ